MDELTRIAEFIIKSFIHIWPYLLITIPLAVAVNISGISDNISGVFRKNPVTSVFLATIVGAFSPFCSCGVIPVISSLLIGGVPIAPVMSFWIASPSMDPEIFFLSTSSLGWNIAIWRLASTFIMSLGAGYITHALVLNGFLPDKGLRMKKVTVAAGGGCCVEAVVASGCDCGKGKTVISFRLIMSEAIKATIMVAKFMGLAFLITALMKFYIPENIINGITQLDPSLQVIIAALTGIPLYTTNLTALPIAGSLLEEGLSGGAALSFLIAGATTTLPAMAAVYGITSRRLFCLYISFALAGAVISGFLYNLVV